MCYQNENRNVTLLNGNFTNLTQTNYIKKVCVHKGHTSDKTTVQKCFKLDQAFMNNVEKTSNCVLSLEDYHYYILNTLFRSLLSQNIENLQITYSEVYFTSAPITSK